MASNFNAGIINMTIDGITYPVVGEAKYAVSGVKNETKGGQSGIYGFNSMPAAGKMSATLRDFGDLSTADLNAISGSTIAFELNNGKLIVGNGMWWVGDPAEVNTAEGTLDVTFEGPDVSETPNA